MDKKIFINRRRENSDRREDQDPCKDMDIDLYHRKRRKKADRRQERSIDEDYYAFIAAKENIGDNSANDNHFH